MPARDTPLVTGSYYHVFNRGVAKQPIFLSDSDYRQALLTASFYQYSKPTVKLSRFKRMFNEDRSVSFTSDPSKKLVDILSYAFMPNHFHFLLKQNQDYGIPKFISQFSNSYTRFFNVKHTRNGHVLQGSYKVVAVESGEQLIHLSRYIHLNPLVSGMVNKPEDYVWSSYRSYIHEQNDFIKTSPVMAYFDSWLSYQQFVNNHADYAKELEHVKHLTLDTE